MGVVTTRIRWLIEIAAFIGIIVADTFGYVPLTQTLYLLPLVLILTTIAREKPASFGLARPVRWRRAIGLGVVIGIAMELSAVFVTTPLFAMLTRTPPDYSGLAGIHGNVQMLLLFLGLSWAFAAFGEEYCFRGFLMRRVAMLFGGSDGAWVGSLVLSSAIFGWGHTEQGLSGWLQEGLAGFLLGCVFLWTGRSLIVPMIAHGVSNTLAFILIFVGYYPGIGKGLPSLW